MDASHEPTGRHVAEDLSRSLSENTPALYANARSNWARAVVNFGLFLNTSGIVVAMWVFIYLYFWGGC